MASSIMIPIAINKPTSDIMLMLKPKLAVEQTTREGATGKPAATQNE